MGLGVRLLVTHTNWLPVHEGDIACPSDMIAIADAPLVTRGPVMGAGPQRLGPPWLPFGPASLWPMGGEPLVVWPLDLGARLGDATGLRFQRQRHADRWNVVFCDGHVEGLTTKQFLDPRSDAVLRRWYADHQPYNTDMETSYLRSLLP